MQLKLSLFGGVFLLLAALVLAGCMSDGDDLDANMEAKPKAAASATATAEAPKTSEGSITAVPNPVPAGSGNGRTRIVWKTNGYLGVMRVYVSIDGGPEHLVTMGDHTEGSQEVDWIATGSAHEFRLYVEPQGSRRLVDKVVVTRAK